MASVISPEIIRGWASGLVEALGPAWGERHLHRPGSAVDVASLLTVTDAHGILCDGRARIPHVMLVAQGGPVLPFSRYCGDRMVNGQPVAGFFQIDRAQKVLREGASVKFNELQDYWRPAKDALAALGEELQTPGTVAQAFLSPPGAAPSDVHQDFPHVVVVHLAGAKHWEVYEHFDGQDGRGTLEVPPGVEPARYTLRAGDVLYMPPGMPHLARNAGDQWSLHLSFGFSSMSVRKVLQRRFRELLESVPDVRIPARGGSEVLAALASELGAALSTSHWDETETVIAPSADPTESLARFLSLSAGGPRDTGSGPRRA